MAARERRTSSSAQAAKPTPHRAEGDADACKGHSVHQRTVRLAFRLSVVAVVADAR